MGRKAIQVEEDVFKEVRAMYPALSWTEILRQYVLTPRGLPKDSPRGSNDSINITNVYATKSELKELKDKFSMVLTQLIDKNKLKR
jgi:predicted CopG family antitoxin